jgi:hypothetical protein
MGMMLALGGMRRTLLSTAVFLIVAGFASLAVSDNESSVPSPRFVSPTFGTVSPFDSLPSSTTLTSLRARHHGTWVNGEYIDTPRAMPPDTTTTGPPQDPATQVDAAVPAAGAQVSFGQGPGSCTDVAITALTPDDCPPPEGDDPVIVDPGPAPSAGPITGPKNGFVAA